MMDLLRKLIREEIGRDLKSTRPDPLTWRSYDGIHVIIAADAASGHYQCQVKVDGRKDLSTSIRTFKDETEAMSWCRINADNIRKKLLGSPGSSIVPPPAALFPSGNGD